MRLEGIVYVKIKCQMIHGKIEVPILFSCNAETDGDNRFKLRNFLPFEVVKILKKVGKFFVKLPDRKLRRAHVTNVVGNCEVESAFSDDVIEEKRLFDRFSFCLGKANEFLIRDINLKSFLIDISPKGVSVLIPKNRLKLSEGEFLVLNRGTDILVVQIKRVKESEGGVLVGGEIKNVNFDVMKFIVNNYVEQVKRILSQRL